MNTPRVPMKNPMMLRNSRNRGALDPGAIVGIEGAVTGNRKCTQHEHKGKREKMASGEITVLRCVCGDL